MKLSVWFFGGMSQSDCGNYDWDHCLSSKSILGASLVALVLCHSAALKCHKDKTYLRSLFIHLHFRETWPFRKQKGQKRTWSCSQTRGGPACLSEGQRQELIQKKITMWKRCYLKLRAGPQHSKETTWKQTWISIYRIMCTFNLCHYDHQSHHTT